MDRLIYKIVPHSYTYPHSSFRKFNRFGVKLKADISDFLGHGLYFGYDNEESRSYDRLLNLVKPGFLCIDVGANIGYVSMRMGSAQRDVTVIGFEPDPLNYFRAKENLALNHFDNISIHHLGLGEQKGEAVMEIRTAGNLGGNRIGKSGTSGEKVPITTLDLFFDQRERTAIDLIKIDVEGYELKVLKGAKKILSADHPILFVEINDDNLRYQGDTAHELIKYLMELGYKDFIHTGNGAVISDKTDFKNLHFDLLAQA